MSGYTFKLVGNYQYIQCVSAPTELDFHKMKNAFRKHQKGYFLKPAFRKGYWDGYDGFFNDVYLPVGLWGELQTYLNKQGYPFVCDGLSEFLNSGLDRDVVVSFVADLFENTVVDPRWYQIESIYRILQYRYSAQHISTSAGKTMISFAVAAYLRSIKVVDVDNKFLLVVPRASLVKQTYDKFVNVYDNGMVKMRCVMICGDSPFDEYSFAVSHVVISTYQSLNNLHADCFKKISSINIDEAHTARTESIKNIIKNSSPLKYRFGLSGTLMDDMDNSNYYQNLEQLGPLTFVYNPKDLIADGFAPNVEVIVLNLDYSNRNSEPMFQAYMEYRNNRPVGNSDEELLYFKTLYGIERELMLSDDVRLNAVMGYMLSFDKNTLLLYTDVKGQHGVKIKEFVSSRGVDCDYIDGSTKMDDRELYTTKIEDSDRMVLVASFGTFSTGIDLKNVHYIGLMESFKSPTLIGQSIGRGLRQHKTKEKIVIIDVVDGMYKHTTKQFESRRSIYNEQGYNIKYVNVVL